jgi:hypothetical protein
MAIFLVALLSRRVAVSQTTQPDHMGGSREFSCRADPLGTVAFQ